MQPGDIAVCGDTIVGTLDSYRGVEEIDAQGRFAVPGFIDSHVHCESTLVTPGEFDRCVLPHGATTAVCDPHEIANVLGLDRLADISWIAPEQTVLDLRVQLSSCVPATELETSGARLTAADLLPHRASPPGDWAGRVHERARRTEQGSRVHGEAGRLLRTAYRRACSAALRPCG